MRFEALNTIMNTSSPRSTAPKQNIFGAIIQCPSTGRYLMVLGRKAMKWSFPKGHAEVAESDFECLVREVFEETGYIDTEMPYPVRNIQLKVGSYYEFHMPTEFEIKPIDTKEIVEGRWMTKDEILTLEMNIDASYYFRTLLVSTTP